MRAAKVRHALALLSVTLVDKCVPKTRLAAHGPATGADKRHVKDAIERTQWLAALKRLSLGRGQVEEQGMAGLFQPGGSAAISHDSFRGVDDFEVVALLAILPSEGEA